MNCTFRVMIIAFIFTHKKIESMHFELFISINFFTLKHLIIVNDLVNYV